MEKYKRQYIKKLQLCLLTTEKLDLDSTKCDIQYKAKLYNIDSTNGVTLLINHTFTYSRYALNSLQALI